MELEVGFIVQVDDVHLTLKFRNEKKKRLKKKNQNQKNE